MKHINLTGKNLRYEPLHRSSVSTKTGLECKRFTLFLPSQGRRQEGLTKEDTLKTTVNFLHGGFLYAMPVAMLLLLFISFADAQSSQTGAGSTYANVTRSGSSTQWRNLTNAASSNDAYAEPLASLLNNGNYTDYLKSTNFNFSIPAGSSITGIEVNVERSDGNGKSKDSRVRLVKGGTIGSTDKAKNQAWGGTDAVQTYGNSSDLWGTAWTPSDINAPDFGVAFACERSGGGGQSALAKVDEIFVTVYYNDPLPVELVYFKATNMLKNVHLSWKTATETNNNYFTLERSEDGISFFSLATLKGAGSSKVANTYDYTDETPLRGISYYRLKQTDFNGNSETFSLVSVSKPEPTNKEMKLNIKHSLFSESFSAEFTIQEPDNLHFQITDMNGALIYSKLFRAEKGVNTIFFSSEINLKAGAYMIRVFNSREFLAGEKIFCTGR